MIINNVDSDFILNKIEKSLNILYLQKEYAEMTNFAWLEMMTDNNIKTLLIMKDTVLYVKNNPNKNCKIDLDYKDLLFIEHEIFYNCDGLQKFLLTKNIECQQ